jgi:hypothetical protein
VTGLAPVLNHDADAGQLAVEQQLPPMRLQVAALSLGARQQPLAAPAAVALGALRERS